MDELIRQAQEGEIERQEFERRVAEVTLALLLLSFLAGSRLSLTQINTSVDAQLELASVERETRAASRRLARDVYEQRVFDEREEADTTPADRRANRVLLWASTILGAYALGQMFRPDDPILRWEYGPTDHCEDCARLNGEERRASEWRQSPYQPQGRNLQCGGFHCQCQLVEVSDAD